MSRARDPLSVAAPRAGAGRRSELDRRAFLSIACGVALAGLADGLRARAGLPAAAASERGPSRRPGGSMSALTLDRWQRLSAAEREQRARRLSGELPGGFVFTGIVRCALGDRRHDLAQFRWRNRDFVLVPGGPVTLGFDAGRGWEPSGEELASWRESAAEYGLPADPLGSVTAFTLRPRAANPVPLLVETAAAEVGWEDVPPDDPALRAALRDLRETEGSLMIHEGDSILRVERDGAGVHASRGRSLTHATLRAELAREGFRLPTSDEWEYLCGAGAPTLFRWGDHVPSDRYPTDVSPEERDWRREWALSGGKLARPKEGFASDWELHRRPNAFGLTIAYDPYRKELVEEPGVTRGGDGGVTICGGAGFLLGWLTLATAWFDPDSCRYEPGKTLSPGFHFARRVLALA